MKRVFNLLALVIILFITLNIIDQLANVFSKIDYLYIIIPITVALLIYSIYAIVRMNLYDKDYKTVVNQVEIGLDVIEKHIEGNSILKKDIKDKNERIYDLRTKSENYEKLFEQQKQDSLKAIKLGDKVKIQTTNQTKTVCAIKVDKDTKSYRTSATGKWFTDKEIRKIQ